MLVSRLEAIEWYVLQCVGEKFQLFSTCNLRKQHPGRARAALWPSLL